MEKLKSFEGSIFVGIVMGIIVAIISFNISETQDDIFFNMIKGYWLIFIIVMSYFAICFYRDMKKIRDNNYE